MSRCMIRNATIYDGTGAPPMRGDVAIDGERIAGVGAVSGQADVEIDAGGLALAPGFIDVHTHDDFAAVLHPDMGFKVRGGVTTCVVGNCGWGVAPHPQAILIGRAFHPHATLPVWEGYAGYLAHLAAHPPSVNIGVLVGHGTLRLAAMPGAPHPPSAGELEQMKSHLSEGIEAGALGFSTGLIYEPGRHADTDEIVELASVMAGTGAIYTTHMRNEANRLVEAVDEAIEIGERAGVPVQISHHKAAGRANWGLVSKSIQRIEAAQARGLDVHADQYPYTAGSTILAAVVQDGGLGLGSSTDELETVVIASTADHPAWEGRSLKDFAEEWNVSGGEAARRILAEEPVATVVLHSMDENDVQTVMRHPSTMIGSDGIPTLDGKPHPRLYGTFARVLGHYARDLGIFALEEGVHRMTGFSARKFGLTDRGEIRPGAFADLVLFDPETIIDRGTFEDPNQYPDGIVHVFVNGAHVVNDGQHTGARPGRPLRRA